MSYNSTRGSFWTK